MCSHRPPKTSSAQVGIIKGTTDVMEIVFYLSLLYCRPYVKVHSFILSLICWLWSVWCIFHICVSSSCIVDVWVLGLLRWQREVTICFYGQDTLASCHCSHSAESSGIFGPLRLKKMPANQTQIVQWRLHLFHNNKKNWKTQKVTEKKKKKTAWWDSLWQWWCWPRWWRS